MLFLTLSGADIDFWDQKLRWKTYTIKEAFLTTRHIKLIGKKEFAVVVLDPEHKTFIVHIILFGSTRSLNFIPLDADIHFSHRP